MSHSNLESPKIYIVNGDTQEFITVPLDANFGTLRFQFEDEGIIKEFPIVPRILHDFFIKELYIHKDSIKS
jgi:hypothetical protein